jgi:IclR family acetate operon transcriptional repressor
MTEVDAPGPMTRWVSVLAAFTDADEWGVRDLAVATGMSPSATHRLLHSMRSLGLVQDATKRGRTRVGPELLRLAVLLSERSDASRVARPVLEQTAAEIGETIVLALYSPARRKFWAVDAVESTHTIRYIWEALRTWTDLSRGATGKGILAFLPEEEREAILATMPDPIDGLVPRTKAELRAELTQARVDGYVVSHGERVAGAVGISAPIHDASGRVIGDIVAAWPDNRTSAVKERRVALAVVAGALRISTDLGFRRAKRSSRILT